MSSQTTNLHLVKPAYSEAADVAVINSNMDTIDTYTSTNRSSLAKAQSGLAYIVGNTNTTGGTLSSDTYVYVKGHSSIDEELRVTTASISNNGSITTSNTSAVSGGGLNSLNSKINGFRVYNGSWRSYSTLIAALEANTNVYADYIIVLVNAVLSGGVMYFGYIFTKDVDNKYAQFWDANGNSTILKTTNGGTTWS